MTTCSGQSGSTVDRELIFKISLNNIQQESKDMASLRIRLSKKIFMSLKKGQYIMDNYIPSKYEEIGQDLQSQWEKWKKINGNTVNIFDSREECLAAWWSIHSGKAIKLTSKTIFTGKISKKIFMELKNGNSILFTQGGYEYIELSGDREKQWLECRDNNGRMVKVFNNVNDLIIARNDMLARFIQE